MSGRARGTAALLLALVALLGAAGSAAAQEVAPEDLAEMRVVERSASGPMRMDYVVRLTSFATGEPITDGEVTATAVGPNDTRIGPLPVEPTGTEPGLYGVSIDFGSTGRWQVAITSASPPITIDVAETVVEPPGTTTSLPESTVAAGADSGGGISVRTVLALVAVAGLVVLAVLALRPGPARRGRHAA